MLDSKHWDCAKYPSTTILFLAPEQRLVVTEWDLCQWSCSPSTERKKKGQRVEFTVAQNQTQHQHLRSFGKTHLFAQGGYAEIDLFLSQRMVRCCLVVDDESQIPVHSSRKQWLKLVQPRPESKIHQPVKMKIKVKSHVKSERSYFFLSDEKARRSFPKLAYSLTCFPWRCRACFPSTRCFSGWHRRPLFDAEACNTHCQLLELHSLPTPDTTRWAEFDQKNNWGLCFRIRIIGIGSVRDTILSVDEVTERHQRCALPEKHIAAQEAIMAEEAHSHSH